eukprot:2986336-Pyramimonas_sp.AAC.1
MGDVLSGGDASTPMRPLIADGGLIAPPCPRKVRICHRHRGPVADVSAMYRPFWVDISLPELVTPRR